uniref:Uncharacterized protein n=1 Tax=viral metagenome TaxID=1070528 RepID=A0A2V0R9M8_9ZZZZ
MNFRLSFEQGKNLISKDLVLIVEPSYSFVKLLPFFMERFRLHSSARIDAFDFKSIFYLLLYVRLIGPQNQHLSQIVYNYLHTIQIPRGLQKIIHFMPLYGLSFNYKNHVLTFKLSQSLVDEIEAGIKDHSYFAGASNLSRHLVGNKNSLSEKFNEHLMFSMSQTFQVSSYIAVSDNNQRLSDQSSLALRCGTSSPDFNIGIALSFVFCLSAKDCQELDRLLGITWSCEMSNLSFELNVRKAFAGLLSGIDNEPKPSKPKGVSSEHSIPDISSFSKSTSDNSFLNNRNLMKVVMNRDNKALTNIVASVVLETLRVMRLNGELSNDLVRA